MNTTLTCTDITITSDVLSVSNLEQKVYVYTNCETTPTYQKVLTAPFTSTISITSTSITSLDSFSTGVYKIEMVIKKSDGSYHKESQCRFIDCDEMECRVITDFEAKPENALLYQALKAFSACPQCDCSKICKIYNELIPEDTNECGCNESSMCSCG